MEVVSTLLKQLGLSKLFGNGQSTDYVLLGLVTIGLLYFFTIWQTDYFKRRGIKNIPFRIPFVGNMYKTLTQKEHLLHLVARTYKEFPDQRYVGHMQMNRPLIMIRDLDIVKQVGIKAFDNFINHQVAIDQDADSLFGNNLFSLKGEKWRDMRATLSPAFTSSKMRNMFEFVTEIGDQMAKYYLEQMKNDQNQEKGLIEVEMKDAFTRYANDVIATSAFGIKFNSLTERNNEFYTMANKMNDFSSFQKVKIFLLFAFPKLMKILKIPLFKVNLKDFFRSIVLNTMAKREMEGIVRQDMIHLLMEARKGQLKHEESTNETEESGFATVKESEVGRYQHKRKWTDDDIVAQALLFLLAGFDTSSTLLCFLAHELTINPDVQKRLQVEVDDIFNEKKGHLEYKDLTRMTYMDMVVSETLRMWPPAVTTDRECLKPFELPPVDGTKTRGYTVVPGEGIWIPIYGFHHDPQYFPNPEKFDPERFSEDNKDSIKPFSYLPFGIGPRNCIGSRFALMEVKAVIFHMLAHFDFVPLSKTMNPIEISTKAFNLIPDNGFWIGLKPRRME